MDDTDRIGSSTAPPASHFPATSQCPFNGVRLGNLVRELGLAGMDAFIDTKPASLNITCPTSMP